MTEFFAQPVLNSPYERPRRHWELDETGQPTQQIVENRRPAEFITAAITQAEIDHHPVKAVLDPYNPVGSTAHVNFNTTKTSRWQTDSRRCPVNWIVLDSDWEAEFCRLMGWLRGFG